MLRTDGSTPSISTRPRTRAKPSSRLRSVGPVHRHHDLEHRHSLPADPEGVLAGAQVGELEGAGGVGRGAVSRKLRRLCRERDPSPGQRRALVGQGTERRESLLGGLDGDVPADRRPARLDLQLRPPLEPAALRRHRPRPRRQGSQPVGALPLQPAAGSAVAVVPAGRDRPGAVRRQPAREEQPARHLDPVRHPEAPGLRLPFDPEPFDRNPCHSRHVRVHPVSPVRHMVEAEAPVRPRRRPERAERHTLRVRQNLHSRNPFVRRTDHAPLDRSAR